MIGATGLYPERVLKWVSCEKKTKLDCENSTKAGIFSVLTS